VRYTILLTVLLWVAFTTTASAQRGSSQKTAGQTIHGCLTGDRDGYWLQQPDGTQRALIGDYRELGAHIGQFVQLAGQGDQNRDASASSDEATAHGLRFFEVWSVTQTQGECRKRVGSS